MEPLVVLVAFFVVTITADAAALRFGLNQNWMESSFQSLVLNNLSLVLLPLIALPLTSFARSSMLVDALLFSPPAWLVQSIVIESLVLRYGWGLDMRRFAPSVLTGNVAGFAIAFGAYPVTAALIG